MTGLDTVRSQLFRLSLEDLVDLERKRKCGMSRREILANVYCPVTPTSPVITPSQVTLSHFQTILFYLTNIMLILDLSFHVNDILNFQL